jgi:hypothetical protein
MTFMLGASLLCMHQVFYLNSRQSVVFVVLSSVPISHFRFLKSQSLITATAEKQALYSKKPLRLWLQNYARTTAYMSAFYISASRNSCIPIFPHLCFFVVIHAGLCHLFVYPQHESQDEYSDGNGTAVSPWYLTGMATGLTGMLTVPFIQAKLATKIPSAPPAHARIRFPFLFTGTLWAFTGACVIHPLYVHIFKPIFSPATNSPNSFWLQTVSHFQSISTAPLSFIPSWLEKLITPFEHILISFSSVTLENSQPRNTESASNLSLSAIQEPDDIITIKQAYRLEFQVKELQRKLDTLSALKFKQ